MPQFDARSPLSAVLATPEGRAILEEHAPELFASPAAFHLAEFPLRSLLNLTLGDDDPRPADIVERVSTIDDPRPVADEEPAIDADRSYEAPTVLPGSAAVTLPDRAHRHQQVEVELRGPSHGNPFVDVEVSATFTSNGEAVWVGGFYDGDGRYLLRFLPPTAGTWHFTTTSTARSLDGVRGVVQVEDSTHPGPVRVADGFHFAYADGTAYRPIGTTAYVWTHQGQELEDQTLGALRDSPFTKVRMCLFPKDFLYNSNEPERFVWEQDADGAFDTTRFDVEYWHHLERRIGQLGDLGIEADLILFHPYDRWGFSRQSRAADDRYVRYLVRRLSAFPNVWWSLANEYDLMPSKRPEDWDRIAHLIKAEDHVGHLLSVHNWLEIWDYASPWATHCSIQAGEQLAKKVTSWRRRWGKPVLVDECGYEGDIDQGWGSLTGEEMVRRFWEVMLSGGYATHGETFDDPDEILWWSKGGVLHGESADRLKFLRRIVEESPTGRLDPQPSDWDCAWGGEAGKYLVLYFGANRPSFRDVVIPVGMAAEIDVIDTWGMTIETRPGVHSGAVRVDLPARPYTAIRLRAVT